MSILLTVSSYAQDASIKGVVKDEKEAAPYREKGERLRFARSRPEGL